MKNFMKGVNIFVCLLSGSIVGVMLLGLFIGGYRGQVFTQEYYHFLLTSFIISLFTGLNGYVLTKGEK